ncbi:PDDEXK nuclease domain-containing protein [Sinomonas sp. JGH33]|uniref:PDDEXK nuclease domain-containing protein n=1 Tax=Sinomonas terricola TaxID=3110330 RepID=A0ABU5T7A1_9MICC|nr:PDDEXK nuclease domain-containing protein [Sinomonas sp. JGH33]MEA5455468.1 PDDEXK nuclease domain-containing protein [Sinomonas sp. JGH33]
MELEQELPRGYAEVLASLRDQVRSAQHRARRAANTAMIELYWGIGRTILNRQAIESWGSKVLGRLSADLRAEFPHMKGFSPRNLAYMRSFASAWNGPGPIQQQAVAELPWGHITILLTKFKDRPTRDWYAAKAVQHGWSRPVLEHHILTRLHTRTGAAPNNLEARLPGEGTDLSRDLAKDPLVLDFLGLTEEAEELAIEEAMTLRMSQTLAEFGPGFAFVARQYRLTIEGDDEFFIDLLLFHIPSNRYVVVELKAGKFRPEHLGQLNFYVAVVDDLLRLHHHAPTVGILVCGSKNDRTVRYALDGSTQPLAVTSYTYETLPAEEKAALPSPAAITAALAHGGAGSPSE